MIRTDGTRHPGFLRRWGANHAQPATFAGILVGAFMGAFATFWWWRASFLFALSGELVISWVASSGSRELAACMGTPLTFFVVHFLLGLVGGWTVAVVLGLVLAWLRPQSRPRVAGYVALVLAPLTFAYTLLWSLHARFPPGHRLVVIALILVGSVAVAAAVWWILARLTHLLERRFAPRPALELILKSTIGGISVLLVVMFLLGLGRHFGRNRDVTTMDPLARRYKVVVIGLDGATWSLLNPYLEAGDLPHLARLRDEGVHGQLRSSKPPIKSPVIWTSIATGKRPDRHGIHDFIVKVPGTNQRVPASNRLRTASAFWEIASAFGLQVDMVSWYTSWPAQEINGVFVSDRLLYPELEQTVLPESWEPRIRVHSEAYRAARDSLLARFTPYPYDPEFWSRDPGTKEYMKGWFLHILNFSHHKDTVVFGTARDVLATAQPDLFAVYFEGPDRNSHTTFSYDFARRHPRLADLLYSDMTPEDIETFGNILHRYYMQVDAWIGELLEYLDDQTAVLVISDHGFGLRYPRQIGFEPKPLLEFLGYLDTVPGGEGRVAWETTRAWGYHDATIGAKGRIFVNLSGREDQGIIEAEAAPALLDELYQVLDGLTTGQGTPIFEEIDRPAKAVRMDSQGDLIARLNPACLGDTLRYDGRLIPVSAFTEIRRKPGNHRIDGIFLGWGGPFRHGERVATAGILDVAPTILKLLGVPPAKDMDGRPLDRAFRSDVRADMVEGLVATYPKEPLEGDATEPSAADADILDQLRALGYIK